MADAAPDAAGSASGGPLTPQPTADGAAALSGRLEPGDHGTGPVLVVGDRRVPWALIGEMLARQGGVDLTLTIGSGLIVVPDPPREPDFAPKLGLRAPVDEFEAERWEEAVALLAEMLGPDRHPCPMRELVAACTAARAGAARRSAPWPLVVDAAGWLSGPPAEDVDLWTSAAMALISVAVDGMDLDAAQCLDAVELNDWLAAVIELVRSGPGTRADADALLALAAGCLELDNAAADPDLAPVLKTAFGALAPVWRALGALDAEHKLTPLGAWGLPLALARAWGGWL